MTFPTRIAIAAVSALCIAGGVSAAAAQEGGLPGMPGGSGEGDGGPDGVRLVSEFDTASTVAWLSALGMETDLLALPDGSTVIGTVTPEAFRMPGMDLSRLAFAVEVVCPSDEACSQLLFNAFFEKPAGMQADAVNAFNQIFPDQKLVMLEETVILQAWVPATYGITGEQLNFRLGHFIGSAGRLRASMGTRAEERNAALPGGADMTNRGAGVVRGIRAAAMAGDPGRGGLPALRLKDRGDIPLRPVNR